MTTHKYDTLLKLMLELSAQAATCHVEATKLGLKKTTVWLLDVAHENSRRMNILLTDIEASTIGNEIDAADALRGHEERVLIANVTAEGMRKVRELTANVTMAHGGTLFPIPMLKDTLLPLQIVPCSPLQALVDAAASDEMPVAFLEEAEQCKFCGHYVVGPCETPPPDYCTYGSSNALSPHQPKENRND